MIDRNLFLSADGWSYDSVHPVPSEEITAIMLDLADLKPNEKVLEIGTGSGYQTACWAETGATVYTVDMVSDGYDARMDLLRRAERASATPERKKNDPDNQAVLLISAGDGCQGWPGHAEYGFDPFDCIILTCGVQEIPPPLISQLKENGTLIAPVGDAAGQELRRYQKQNGELRLDRIAAGTRFVMME